MPPDIWVDFRANLLSLVKDLLPKRRPYKTKAWRLAHGYAAEKAR